VIPDETRRDHHRVDPLQADGPGTACADGSVWPALEGVLFDAYELRGQLVLA
jgi:hypothetical protein